MSDATSADIISAPERTAGELKPGWRIVRFGDVVRDVKVTVDPETSGLERYIAGEHMNTDDLHIRQWGTIGVGYLGPAFHRKFVKGQVLYGSRRTYLRKVALADFDGICANTTFVLEPKDGELLPDLLPFIMQTESFSTHAVKQSRGSVNPYVIFRDIAWYEFALPPKDEQRRIADILWAADDVLQKYNNCVIEVTRAQTLYLGSHLFANAENSAWSDVSLDDVCSIQNGQIDPRISPYSNMIHIAPDDIESQTGRILETRTATEDGVTSGNYEFGEQAILYSKIRPNLRKVAMPLFSGVCSADVYPVYAKPNVLTEFLFYVLLSEQFTSYATANSVRSAIPKLNREAMLKYKFKLPQLNEQKRILKILQLYTSANRMLEQHVNKLTNLKNKLLSDFLNAGTTNVQ